MRLGADNIDRKAGNVLRRRGLTDDLVLAGTEIRLYAQTIDNPRTDIISNAVFYINQFEQITGPMPSDVYWLSVVFLACTSKFFA